MPLSGIILAATIAERRLCASTLTADVTEGRALDYTADLTGHRSGTCCVQEVMAGRFNHIIAVGIAAITAVLGVSVGLTGRIYHGHLVIVLVNDVLDDPAVNHSAVAVRHT